MRAKTEELRQAREMRQSGVSVNEIARKLKVSKGSVSCWVRDIKLTQKQLNDIQDKFSFATFHKRNGAIRSAKYKELREQYQKEGADRVKDIRAGKEGHLFLCGCMLYWAEGTKKQHVLQLTNSDANMLKFYLTFLTESLKIARKDIQFTCHYYTCNGLSSEAVERHWSKILNVPKDQFHKTTVDHTPRISTKRRQERTKFGVVKITVYDTRLVQIVYGALQEYGGFKNEEWLDNSTPMGVTDTSTPADLPKDTPEFSEELFPT